MICRCLPGIRQWALGRAAMVYLEQWFRLPARRIKSNGLGPIERGPADHCSPRSTWLSKPLLTQTFDSLADFRVK
jgi:hypothetical protein